MAYRKLPENRVLGMLTEDEVLQVHSASLEILQNVGISTNSKRTIDVLTRNEAKIKGDTGHLTIPTNVISEALKTAPKEIHLHGRNPKNEIVLERGRVYFGFGGTPPHQLLDLDTGKSRASTKADVANATRLGDALRTWPS
jgi:trimethylamine--corrinoid protein Co-methyltransferase